MKAKIMILSALDYVKDDKERGCIQFIFCDKEKFQDSDNFIGYSVCTQYYYGYVRKLVPKEYIGVPLDADFKVTTNFKDPLRTYNKIESISLNGKTINLLQAN